MPVASAPTRPHEIIWNLTNAVMPARSLHVIALLGVADLIDNEPVPSSELATRCGANPEALDRVLQLLVAQGVFASGAAGYTHTDASRLLRSDHPMSMRAFAQLMNLPVCRAAYDGLEHSVRSGAPAVELLDPGGFFAYLESHPEEAAVFGEAMRAKAHADIAAVLDGYDFRPFKNIADIGGGRGHLVEAVLDRVPAIQGILFDLPEVIDTLGPASERLTRVAGDFFIDPLPTADAYVLMEVLHDWSDRDATRILRAIRRACTPGATVLIIEDVLPEDVADSRARILDVVMLIVTGGRERSSGQFARLLHTAGFQPSAVIETAGAMRIVEGIAV
ncbi:MAG TPA: methyltransferase [Chloroflexota bacterium]